MPMKTIDFRLYLYKLYPTYTIQSIMKPTVGKLKNLMNDGNIFKVRPHSFSFFRFSHIV